MTRADELERSGVDATSLLQRLSRQIDRLEVEEFLFGEAALLDDRRYEEWIALFEPDATYEMPIRVSRAGGVGETEGRGRIFDDTVATLDVRIRRLRTGLAWAEDPPSRTRHFVSNVLVESRASLDETSATSNLLLYRNRGDSPNADILSARRVDVLHRHEAGWRIAHRRILIDQSTVNSRNLSFFF